VSEGGNFKRNAGLAGAAVTLAAAAGATARVLANRRRRARRAAEPTHALGSLRGEPQIVVADDGLELYVEVDEPEDRRDAGLATVVFVHGYALSLDSWHFQREAFRGTRRLVFYDQRSHGRSGRSRKEHATIGQLGRDLRSVLDQVVGEGPVILVGHSMGGMTVMAFADDEPACFGPRVVGVALASSSSGNLSSRELLLPGAPGRWINKVAPSVVATLALTPRLVESGRRVGAGVSYALTRNLAFGGPVPEEYVEFTEQMLAATPFDVVAEFFPAFDTLDMSAALKALSAADTVVVCGTEDVVTPIDHSRRIAELVPTAELVEIEGAGHMVILERFDEVNDAIARLLTRVDDRE
jgi:pimeloyl-ACP methyl ester carboxylesterase